MSARRGLTLVEVLAATVLLTVLAGACVPLMERAMRALDDPAAPIDRFELAVLADQFMDEPAAFGMERPPQDETIFLTWPEQLDRPPVTVRRLRASDTDVDHAWIEFACGEAAVWRWIADEPQKPETAR